MLRRNEPTSTLRHRLQQLALVCLVVVDLLLAAAAQPARADDDNPFEELAAVSSDELQDMRGGLQVGGLNLDIGANLRTYVDGRLALESVIRYTDVGTQIEHRPGSAGGADASIPLVLNSAGNVTLGLRGVDPARFKGAGGVQINDARGNIVAMHDASSGRITSVIINQSNGRDIRQELAIDVTVHNFAQFRDSLRGTLLNGRLNGMQR